MENRKAFNFYRSYYEIAKELPSKDRDAFLWALLEKQFENKETDLKGLAKFAYISQKHSIDKQIKGYLDKTKGLKNPNPTEDPNQDPNQDPTEGGKQDPTKDPKQQVQEKGEVQEKEKGEEELNELYKLYPSQTFRDGIKSSTKSKEKNLKKLKTLLSKKEHSFDSLKLAIETEIKSKKVVNGIPEYLKNFGTFLNNLPDIEEQKPEVNTNIINYRWSDEQMQRTIEKDKAESYFANMAQGGYKAIILD